MKKIFNIIILFSLVGFVSCDFASRNTDPYLPGDAALGADGNDIGVFLSSMQKWVIPIGTAQENQITGDENRIVNTYQIACNLGGQVWAGYMAPRQNKWNSGNNFTTYEFLEGWRNTDFDAAIANRVSPWLEFTNKIKQKYPNDYNEQPAWHLAQIIKVAGLHQATDKYGPIPYSSLGSGSIQNSYDSQEDVYKQMFEDLNGAIEGLKALSLAGVSSVMGQFDIVYAGNVNNWIKFANSLKLRLAIRMNSVNDAAVKTLAKQYAEEAIGDGVITTNAENAAIGQKTILFNSLYRIWENYKDTRMSASMESYLKGYKDPRLNAYFMSSIHDDEIPADRVLYGVLGGLDAKYEYNEAAVPNFFPETPLYWLTAAETFFLRAEGALNGWAMGGTAESLYVDGIKASFDQYKLPGADAYSKSSDQPEIYLERLNASKAYNIGSTAPVKFATTPNMQREQIMIQKWISLYPNGQEAWSEIRRTGLPKVFPMVNNKSGGVVTTIASRIPYAPKEYISNKENVEKAVGLLGGPDNAGTKLWWMGN